VGNWVAYVVNKHTKENGFRDRSLKKTRQKIKRRGENTGDADLRYAVWQITANPINVATS
jgi:hypothetical protein